MSYYRKYNDEKVCLDCQLNKMVYNVNLPKDEYDAYVKKQLDTIKNMPQDIDSFEFSDILQKGYEEKFGKIDFTSIKEHFNQILLDRYDELMNNINDSEDPLLLAIKSSLACNYVDFTALSDVSDEKLFELLANADKYEINLDTYEDFKRQLSSASKVLYITDNCGEIVLDKILISIIKRQYPNVKITTMVRGGEVVNDASMVDARQVKLDEVCEVIDSKVCKAGTFLKLLPQDRIAMLENADLIISKGQANVETLAGSGYNIFYIFLCKCDFFAKQFKTNKFDPVFVKERK